MKIKIKKNGLLTVDNVEKYCPMASFEHYCGNWCALFKIIHGNQICEEFNSIEISLCRQNYFVSPEDFEEEK